MALSQGFNLTILDLFSSLKMWLWENPEKGKAHLGDHVKLERERERDVSKIDFRRLQSLAINYLGVFIVTHITDKGLISYSE